MGIGYEEKLKVVARAFYEDGKDDPEYDLNSYDEQYEEMLQIYRAGGLSESFIDTCFELNSPKEEQ